MFKLRDVPGYRFEHLLEHAAKAFPDIRFRFTSPHPKDFPEKLLETITSHHNICNHIHLPAQSGNTEVLFRMRRNHTREAYLNLVQRMRSMIPNIAISTDMMCGFCGETEEQFQDVIIHLSRQFLSLMKLDMIMHFYLPIPCGSELMPIGTIRMMSRKKLKRKG